MPFVTITDPVEAHRYRQAGMLWYKYGSMPWVALTSEDSRKVSLGCQTDNMRELYGARYAILVESEE